MRYKNRSNSTQFVTPTLYHSASGAFGCKDPAKTLFVNNPGDKVGKRGIHPGFEDQTQCLE